MCVGAGVLYLLKKLFTLHDRNLLHGPALSGARAVSWSRPLSMSAVLRVKDVTRSTLNDLLLAVVTSAFRRYLVRSGVRRVRRSINSTAKVSSWHRPLSILVASFSWTRTTRATS